MQQNVIITGNDNFCLSGKYINLGVVLFCHAVQTASRGAAKSRIVLQHTTSKSLQNPITKMIS
jgi:hypothetical protein